MFTWEKVLGEYEGLLESGLRGKVQVERQVQGARGKVQVKGGGWRVDLRERCGSFLTASYRDFEGDPIVGAALAANRFGLS